MSAQRETRIPELGTRNAAERLSEREGILIDCEGPPSGHACRICDYRSTLGPSTGSSGEGSKAGAGPAQESSLHNRDDPARQNAPQGQRQAEETGKGLLLFSNGQASGSFELSGPGIR